MLIVITTPHLSLSDIALLETAAFKEAEHDVKAENVKASGVNAKIVLSGDGVYTSALHSDALSTLISTAAVVAVKDDVLSRGVQIQSDIQLIDNATFATLSTHHQQWVTL